MGRMGLANQLLAPRLQKIRRMVRRTKVTNQRTRKHHVEDTEDVGDIVMDTVYPKEGKVAKESVTRNHLTRRTILSPSLSLRTTLRIKLTMINVPFAGRRATT